MHASRSWTVVGGNFALDEYSCRLIIADSRTLFLIVNKSSNSYLDDENNVCVA